MSAIKGVDCNMQKGDGYQQNPLEKSYFIVKITDLASVRPSSRWLDAVFQGQYLPSFSINYIAIIKDLEKLPPQLYQIKMKICYDQGYNDIVVVIATK